MLKRNFIYGVYLASLTFSATSFATGMVPETSVLLVNESNGEASISVKIRIPSPRFSIPTCWMWQGKIKTSH